MTKQKGQRVNAGQGGSVSYPIYTRAGLARQAIQGAIGDVLSGSTLTGAEVDAVLYVFRNSPLSDQIETILDDNFSEAVQDALHEQIPD
jgi:hypothetical protein